MKIDRLQSLKNCRIFRDFAWPGGLKPFDRFNLIYGWNGSGKTTLSTLFKGLEQGENLLGGQGSLQVDGQARDIESFTAKIPNIRIFNKDTVSRAVFEIPGTRLAPVYVIGEESVDKAKQIEDLKVVLAGQRADVDTATRAMVAEESELEVFCTDRARDIRRLLLGPSSTYNNYEKPAFKATTQRLESMGAMPPVLSEEERTEILGKKDSKPKTKLPSLPEQYPILPDLTKAVDAVLKKSVTSRVIDALAKNSFLAKWVGEGLALHPDRAGTIQCKFCGQELTKDRIKHLEAHFNDEFNRFQVELNGLLTRIRAMHDEIEALKPPTKEQIYDHLAADYEKHRSSFAMQRDSVLRYLDKMREAVEAKKAKPFEVVDWDMIIAPNAAPGSDDSFFITLLKIFMVGAANWGVYVGTEALAKVSAIIQQHNRLCDNFEAEITKARKTLEQDEVLRALPELTKRKAAAESAKRLLEAARAEAERTHRAIAALEADVRGHHSAAAVLTAELAGYLGRQELVFVSEETGYTITRDGAPAMHLSEGERTAIAFLYFLGSLADTSFDPSTGIVVIDDPVSSLDANSIYCAFGYMKEHVKDVAQVFVLTHDFTFFKLVKNWFHHVGKRNGKSDRYYMLQPTLVGARRSAALAKLDPLLSDYESEYHYLFKRVCLEATAAGESMESCYPMPNIARRLLEGFLAFRSPGSEDLHTKMQKFNFTEAKRARIHRFVEVHSHHDRMPQARHDPSILLETRDVMVDLLAFMEVVDKEHYDAMRAATS